MTVLHSLKAETSTVVAVPLTAAGFAPFGQVIENPVGRDIEPATANASSRLPHNATIANQGSAIKISDVSAMDSHYQHAPSNVPARTAVSMFVCHPRPLRRVSSSKSAFDVQILERHPYTTQTFVPMGLSADHVDTCYLVIVAPSLQETRDDRDSRGFLPRSLGKPDLRNLRAFVANGSQAVTYGAGTWHAPMIAVGSSAIDFIVYQFVNGQADEDCQEALVEPALPGQTGAAVMLDSKSRRQTRPRGKL